MQYVSQWLFIIRIGCHAKSHIQYAYFSVQIIVCERVALITNT